MAKQVDLLQGTLDLLILKSVSLGAMHGYGIMVRIGQISGEQLMVLQGSLYPALYRLEAGGALRTSWGESENNRRAKYYELTEAGREQLEREVERWGRMAKIIAGVLRTVTAPEMPGAAAAAGVGAVAAGEVR